MSTFGVNVSENTKSELQNLMKNSNLTGQEFMELLINAYKIEEAKKNKTLDLQSEYTELQLHLSRIQSIFVNIGEKAAGAILMADNSPVFEEEIKAKEIEIQNYKDNAEKLEQEILKVKEDYVLLETTLNDYRTKNEELLKNKKRDEVLIEKLSQEVNHFKEEVEKRRNIDKELEERKIQNTELRNKLDELNSDIWFAKQELQKINNDFENQIYILKEEKKNLISEYQSKITAMENQNELKLANMKFETEISLNKIIQEEKEKNAHLSMQILTLNNDIERLKMNTKNEIKKEK